MQEKKVFKVKNHIARGAALALSFVAAISLTSLSPADAASRNINGWHSAEPCPTYHWCIHYRSWAEGAQRVSFSNIREYTNHRFYGSSEITRGWEGDQQYVRNNAASLNNKKNSIIRSYYSPAYQGNNDVLSPGFAGNLYYTANDNASVRSSW